MSGLLARGTISPEQCSGRPCIRGMHIRVADVLELLAGGMISDEILVDYPYLERADIRTCLAYAAREVNHHVLTYSG